ncbi:MAG: hypothetical protein JW969_17840 [Spirochaetales bacterium]|nr:hypothetical protein [Spirochaetales bacterium]
MNSENFDLGDMISSEIDPEISRMGNPDFKSIKLAAGQKKLRRTVIRYASIAAAVILAALVPIIYFQVPAQQANILISQSNADFITEITDSPILLEETMDISAVNSWDDDSSYMEEEDIIPDIDFTLYFD